MFFKHDMWVEKNSWPELMHAHHHITLHETINIVLKNTMPPTIHLSLQNDKVKKGHNSHKYIQL